MKYEGAVDLSLRNNSHTFIVEMAGCNKRVIEVGCASGFVSRALSERGCRVTGVELDPDAASVAKEFCEQVVVGDVATLDIEAIAAEEPFDVAIFGDVLEHLPDPLPVLRRTRTWLKPDGYVITSIPNIAHGAVRLALLRGRFEYTVEGLLDTTHLRFFTRESTEDLLARAGFLAVETRRTRLGLFDTEIGLDPSDFPAELIQEIEADPDATTYQFVSKAIVDNGQAAVRQLAEREDAISRELYRVQAELGAEQAARAEVEQRLAAQSEALTARSDEVAGLASDLGAMAQEMEQLRAQLAVHEERWDRVEQRLLVRLYRALTRRRISR